MTTTFVADSGAGRDGVPEGLAVHAQFRGDTGKINTGPGNELLYRVVARFRVIEAHSFDKITGSPRPCQLWLIYKIPDWPIRCTGRVPIPGCYHEGDSAQGIAAAACMGIGQLQTGGLTSGMA